MVNISRRAIAEAGGVNYLRGLQRFFAIALTGLVFQNMALAAAPEVRASADIRNAGEIIGVISFCGPAGPNGTHVDLIGES